MAQDHPPDDWIGFSFGNPLLHVSMCTTNLSLAVSKPGPVELTDFMWTSL